jgi:saccharopine dehydrogenase-like NADP-dependent oxidoreductase
MYSICVAGGGTIGRLIALLLADSHDYEVYLTDKEPANLQLIYSHPNLHTELLDVTDADSFEQFLITHNIQVIIASLPYFYNVHVAQLARKLQLYYFDLTEDVAVTKKIKEVAKDSQQAFIPQCGVAPGFINIVANHLMQKFDSLTSAFLRAGCLPRSTHNALQYAITWSVDGLINEYGNECFGLAHGKKTTLHPLDDLEMIELDGTLYEAFNTSGGIGNLVETYRDRIDSLNYKTMRYPGHCEKMRFLMQDLYLNEDRATLKRILEKSLPRTDQDVMLLYVSVAGKKQGVYLEENYVNKLYPQTWFNKTWSAIQVTTACSLCAVVDLVLQEPQHYQGFIVQESFSLEKFLNNRFGKVYSGV